MQFVYPRSNPRPRGFKPNTEHIPTSATVVYHGDVGHQIQLRNGGDLRIPLYAATQSQLFVRYRAIKTWNSLSGDLRSSSSLCTFKNKYDSCICLSHGFSLIYVVSMIIKLLSSSAEVTMQCS